MWNVGLEAFSTFHDTTNILKLKDITALRPNLKWHTSSFSSYISTITHVNTRVWVLLQSTSRLKPNSYKRSSSLSYKNLCSISLLEYYLTLSLSSNIIGSQIKESYPYNTLAWIFINQIIRAYWYYTHFMYSPTETKKFNPSHKGFFSIYLLPTVSHKESSSPSSLLLYP